MNTTERKALSDRFRASFGRLGPTARAEVERTLTETFGYQNVRNIQLMTRYGSQQRDFIGPRLSGIDLHMRVAFARAVSALSSSPIPQKRNNFLGTASQKGRKLRKYLADDYTRQNLTRVIVGPTGELTYDYNADSNSVDETVSVTDSDMDDIFY